MCCVLQIRFFLFIGASICCKVAGAQETFRCYSCGEDQPNIDCGDPFTPGTADIETGCTQCRKFDNEDNSAVRRTCYTGRFPYRDECRDESGHASGHLTCYCKTDLCNHSNSVHVTMATSISAVLVVIGDYIL